MSYQQIRLMTFHLCSRRNFLYARRLLKLNHSECEEYYFEGQNIQRILNKIKRYKKLTPTEVARMICLRQDTKSALVRLIKKYSYEELTKMSKRKIKDLEHIGDNKAQSIVDSLKLLCNYRSNT